jgi:hypothetical protein
VVVEEQLRVQEVRLLLALVELELEREQVEMEQLQLNAEVVVADFTLPVVQIIILLVLRVHLEGMGSNKAVQAEL